MNSPKFNQKNLSRAFIRHAMEQPYLTKEEELALARAWQKNGDKAALDKLINSHIRLAISSAKRFNSNKLSENDFIQIACIGLSKAAHKFNPDKGCRFSTYARWDIRAALFLSVMEAHSLVNRTTTVGMRALFFRFGEEQEEIQKINGFARLTDDDYKTIANKLNAEKKKGDPSQPARKVRIKASDVEHIDQMFFAGDFSLNSPKGNGEEENVTWLDDLYDDEQVNPEEYCSAKQEKFLYSSFIEEAIKRLNPKQTEVFIRRRMKNPRDKLADIGHDIGVGKERVRQIEVLALEKIKETVLALALQHDSNIDLLINEITSPEPT